MSNRIDSARVGIIKSPFECVIVSPDFMSQGYLVSVISFKPAEIIEFGSLAL